MKGNGAFSLVEVMCAVAILGIALLGLTRGLTTGLIGSKEAETQTAAAFLAAGRIESLRADGFIEEGTAEGDATGELTNHRWKEFITESNIRGLFDVEVRVENVKTGKLIYELKTLLFDPPSDLVPESDREKRLDDQRRRQRSRS